MNCPCRLGSILKPRQFGFLLPFGRFIKVRITICEHHCFRRVLIRICARKRFYEASCLHVRPFYLSLDTGRGELDRIIIAITVAAVARVTAAVLFFLPGEETRAFHSWRSRAEQPTISPFPSLPFLITLKFAPLFSFAPLRFNLHFHSVGQRDLIGFDHPTSRSRKVIIRGLAIFSWEFCFPTWRKL